MLAGFLLLPPGVFLLPAPPEAGLGGLSGEAKTGDAKVVVFLLLVLTIDLHTLFYVGSSVE